MMDSARIYGASAPKFRDITSGNNGAPARTGYDMATGRGSWFDGTATTTTPTTTTPTTTTPTTTPTTVGIANSGFEVGSLTGWTPSGAAAAATGNAMGGSYAAQLGNATASNGDSRVAQTFTTSSSARTLSFWYKQTCADPVNEGWVTATLRDNATGVTTTLVPPTCATGAYRQVTSPVTASRSYTLTVTNHDDNVAGEATVTYLDTVLSY
jgi:serine protease